MKPESEERLWSTLGRVEAKIDSLTDQAKGHSKRLKVLENWRFTVRWASLVFWTIPLGYLSSFLKAN